MPGFRHTHTQQHPADNNPAGTPLDYVCLLDLLTSLVDGLKLFAKFLLFVISAIRVGTRGGVLSVALGMLLCVGMAKARH